jgi:ferredoxin-NADP reductase
MSIKSIKARLARKTSLNHDISEFRFAAADGRFTGLEAGAHVDVHLPNGLVRQYSLCDWDPAGRWLAVAVKREDKGRGGSLAVHALDEGALVELGGPRNNFALNHRGQHITLLAGGIGATPILAMARELAAADADFRVVYLTRSRADAALHPSFDALGLGEAYRLHCDDADGLYGLDALMRSMPVDGDIYCCGPEPLLNAVLKAGEHLKGGAIHFERFAAASDAERAPREGFEVEIASTGAVFVVEPDQTILGVLREAGHQVEFGCSEGLCGACMVDVLEGEVDHRDGVLSPGEQEQNGYMCICVSRAKSQRLKLDL